MVPVIFVSVEVCGIERLLTKVSAWIVPKPLHQINWLGFGVGLEVLVSEFALDSRAQLINSVA